MQNPISQTPESNPETQSKPKLASICKEEQFVNQTTQIENQQNNSKTQIEYQKPPIRKP